MSFRLVSLYTVLWVQEILVRICIPMVICGTNYYFSNFCDFFVAFYFITLACEQVLAWSQEIRRTVRIITTPILPLATTRVGLITITQAQFLFSL
jgi:hypothetical protein